MNLFSFKYLIFHWQLWRLIFIFSFSDHLCLVWSPWWQKPHQRCTNSPWHAHSDDHYMKMMMMKMIMMMMTMLMMIIMMMAMTIIVRRQWINELIMTIIDHEDDIWKFHTCNIWQHSRSSMEQWVLSDVTLCWLLHRGLCILHSQNYLKVIAKYVSES